MPRETRFPENPCDQAAILRSNAHREVERIGEADLADRLKVSVESLRRFLNGERPEFPLLRGLSVYDFGPYPDLAQLMAAHFYESYDYDTGALDRWEPAVDQFINGETRGRVVGAMRDIEQLLSSVPENDSVLQTLESIGCRFSFIAIPLTPRQWVQAVYDRLFAALAP